LTGALSYPTLPVSRSEKECAGMRRAVLLVGFLVALSYVSAASSTTRGHNGLIAYALEVGTDQTQLFTIRPDGSGAKRIGGGLSVANPDWSPDGRTIVVEIDKSDTAGVHIFSAGGRLIRNLTPKGFQGQPSFSPDGRFIAYERDVAEGNNGVWLMKADGTGKRRLTRSPFGCCDTDPNFSPDGRTITFVRIKEPEKQQALFAIGRDGKGLRQLTPYSWDVAIKHDWSPDGKEILLTTNADFVRPTESANLVVIRPDGSDPRQLTHFKGGERNAFAGSFSPDGKHIAFRLEQGLQYALATIDLDGSTMRRLTKPGVDKPRGIDWGTHP
jgi:Tol biopolymer transport system component